MIVQTRYRDISFAECRKCVRPPYNFWIHRPEWENRLRAKPVAIVVPAIPAAEFRDVYWRCSGPFYRISGGEPDGFVTCPHIAEIGD